MFLCVALLACGGQITPDEATDATPAVPTFGDGGVTSLPPLACIPCPADGHCGSLVGCVARPGGGGFCAPGCTKDGFCAPDRTAVWVHDLDGHPWRACVPKNNACTDVLTTPGPHHLAGR